MNLPRYAVHAARVLKRELEAGARPGDRARGLLTIQAAVTARARRRRLRWAVAGVTLAAAGLVAWYAAPRFGPNAAAPLAEVTPLGNGAALVTDGHAVPLLVHTPIVSGATVETASEGGAALQLASRSSLLLEKESALRVVPDAKAERFVLVRGAFAAHVAKLSGGRRFIVATPDAEIEVRGTRFALRVLERPQSCGAGSRTRLEVNEGIVEVRASGASSRVTAGQVWPAGCAASASSSLMEASQRPVGSADSPPTPPPLHRPVDRAPAPVVAPAGSSTLTQQNDLFAAGVALRRQGDLTGALRAYQELIAQFPNSPLAENAMVERMRLLSATQRSLAKQEARRYVQRYPRGFALDEAQRLTDAP